MKNKNLLFAFILCMASSVQAQEFLRYDCNSGNGDILLSIASIKNVAVEVVNASGVLDAVGALACNGPNESAFLCAGRLRLSGTPDQFTPLHLVLPESLFQGYGGNFEIGNPGSSMTYYCRKVG